MLGGLNYWPTSRWKLSMENEKNEPASTMADKVADMSIKLYAATPSDHTASTAMDVTGDGWTSLGYTTGGYQASVDVKGGTLRWGDPEPGLNDIVTYSMTYDMSDIDPKALATIFNQGGLVTPPKPAPRPAAGPNSGRGSADLAPGRLRGFREWVVRPARGPRPMGLKSITARTEWPPTPEFNARCEAGTMGWGGVVPKHDADEVPHASCTCGIHAKHLPLTYMATGNIGGVIEAWGPTEIGTEAFRARNARLLALCGPPARGRTPDEYKTWADMPAWTLRNDDDRGRTFGSLGDLLKELGEIYRVPTFLRAEEMVEQYPPIDIAELLGEPEPEPTPSYMDMLAVTVKAGDVNVMCSCMDVMSQRVRRGETVCVTCVKCHDMFTLTGV